jgi:Serine aminopeptidase, S33/Ubiquitin interaction motif
VLGEGATMVSFDFTGSGLSDGDYVTLGFNEKDDLAAVIDYLRGLGSVSSIALWGRSMGAATALLHSHRDPSIAGMVLDSAFADLRQLANELVEMGKAQSGYKVPNFIVAGAIRLVRSSVLKKTATSDGRGGSTAMDIFELRPIKNVDSAFIPALFIAGEQDGFIQPHHSRQIYEKYGGDKNLLLVPGDHNSLRPKFCQDSAAIFLRTVLQIPEGFALEDSMAARVRGLALRGLLATSDLMGGPVVGAASATRVPSSSSSSSLEAAWRATGSEGESAIASSAAARAKAAAAEEVMIRQAKAAGSLKPGLIAATAAGSSMLSPPSAAAVAGAGPGAAGRKGVLSSTAGSSLLPSPTTATTTTTTASPSVDEETERVAAAAVKKDPGSVLSSLTDPGSVLTRREESIRGEHGHLLSSSSSSSSDMPSSLSIGPFGGAPHRGSSTTTVAATTAGVPSETASAAPPSSPQSVADKNSQHRKRSGSGGGGWASALSNSMRSLLPGGAGGGGASRSRSGTGSAGHTGLAAPPQVARQQTATASASSDFGDAFGGLDGDVARSLPSRAPPEPQMGAKGIFGLNKGPTATPAPQHGSPSRLEIFAPRPPEPPARPSLPPPGRGLPVSAVTTTVASPGAVSPTSAQEEEDLQRALALSLEEFTRK